MSHLNYWNLNASPFGDPRAGDSFRSGTFHEAESRIRYLIEGGDRLAILLAPTGMGKTTLLRETRFQFQPRNEAVVLLNTIGLHGTEFLESMVTGLGGMLHDGMSPSAVWRDVFDLIRANIFQEKRTILLFDNVDRAAQEVRDSILRIVHWPAIGPIAPTVIVSATDTRQRTWAQPFADQCPLRIDLEPWELADTSAYLEEGLRRAGRTSKLFDKRAVETIYRLSGGSPRRIARLAEMSLLAGAADQLEMVDAATVESVHAELNFHAEAA
jgi:general secretion pathway protein A